jgi:hypothetical protein
LREADYRAESPDSRWGPYCGRTRVILDGHEVLTAAVPKSVADVEALTVG